MRKEVMVTQFKGKSRPLSGGSAAKSRKTSSNKVYKERHNKTLSSVLSVTSATGIAGAISPELII